MPIIKNAGYLWHRRYVNWQRGDELIGVSEVKKGKAVNFAYQAAIYALYDNNFKCVYIGQAGRGEMKGLYHRLRDHILLDHLFCRWERFSWYGFYSIKSLQEDDFDKEFKLTTDINQIMAFAESLIIQINPPALNMAGGSWADVEWFYQEAEFEEQAAQYEQLKTICSSIEGK